jgi:hypothetical protein
MSGEMVLRSDLDRALAIIAASKAFGAPLLNIHTNNFSTLFFDLVTHRNWNGGPYKAANDAITMHQAVRP